MLRKLLETLVQGIDWVRQHLGFALLIRIGLPVIVLGLPVLAVIASSDDEVSYSVNTVFSLCNSFGKPLKGVTPDNCATWFYFKLANTGDNPQPLVKFSVPAGTAALSDVHILHLVASNEKIPKIEVQTTGQPGTYRISELPPNVLVTVGLSTSGLEQARRLKEGQGVEVRANGRVINVDPHAAVVIRMLYAFFTVLGF
jgi:hypothetical protein